MFSCHCYYRFGFVKARSSSVAAWLLLHFSEYLIPTTENRRSHKDADILFYCLCSLFYYGPCKGQAIATCVPHICGVGYLMPTPAGVAQRRLLVVVVVQTGRAVVLLFLFKHRDCSVPNVKLLWGLVARAFGLLLDVQHAITS